MKDVPTVDAASTIMLLTAIEAMFPDKATPKNTRIRGSVPLPSWPGLSGPPPPAQAATGGPDEPGHDVLGSPFLKR